MKLLHSADWHLDSPMQGHTQTARQLLRQKLLELPGRIAALCRQEECQLVLLSGDLFDGSYTKESYRVVYTALKDMEVPVFVSPGNHDFVGPESPWMRELWPENVHIFLSPRVESVALPGLDCRVYGAGYQEKDCPSLLETFQASCEERYALGVFHGDPTQANSPYNPVTYQQVSKSGLDYLALGHIHKADSFRAGDTLCAWPGCPMGTGYDEQGIKGVYITELAETAECRFVSLDGPRFFDWELDPGENPGEALARVLPGVSGDDFYRVTFTGESQPLDLESLTQQFSGFPNLTLRDRTVLPIELWENAGEDSFEGVYFGMLRAALESATEEEQETILLAAKLSRKILQGQEVELP